MAFATVPAEILSGKDIAQPIPIRDDYGRSVGTLELFPTPIPVYLTLITAMFMHGGLRAHLRKHALPLDLRRQPGGRARPRAVPRLLPRDRNPRGPGARRGHGRPRRQPPDPEPRRLGRDLGRARRLHRALSAAARPRAVALLGDGSAGHGRDRPLVRLPARERRGNARGRDGRRGVRRAHRRLPRRGRAREALRRRPAPGLRARPESRVSVRAASRRRAAS